MKYRTIAVSEAEGAILAHSFQPKNGRRIRKGTQIGSAEQLALTRAGVKTIDVAIPEPGDIGEDEAATLIGARLAGVHLVAQSAATGRVNIHANANGLFVAEKEWIDALNRLDPAITLATLPNHTEVTVGRLVATVKIIPYAVGASSVADAVRIAARGLIEIRPYASRKVGVISTQLPHLKPSVFDKTMNVLQRRLNLSESQIIADIRIEHSRTALANAIRKLPSECDLLLIFGASAICDIDDIVPAAIREVGGEILHFGMPVDPGNLLLLGRIADQPVIGAPGCARSPAENGFDWVLRRILAGLEVRPDDITGMGVGGLLMEIGTRPQPREVRAIAEPRVAALVLAAGQSRRMGSTNKLLMALKDEALVRHPVKAAIASQASNVIVVTGHEGEAVRAQIADLAVETVDNPNYADGLATSLSAGIAAVPEECTHALILLGDMPHITPAMIDLMVAKALASPPGTIVLATFEGKRANPVLWPRAYFDQLTRISGDVGARHLLGENAEKIVPVELGPAAGFDIDTPEMMERARTQV